MTLRLSLIGGGALTLAQRVQLTIAMIIATALTSDISTEQVGMMLRLGMQLDSGLIKPAQVKQSIQ